MTTVLEISHCGAWIEDRAVLNILRRQQPGMRYLAVLYAW